MENNSIQSFMCTLKFIISSVNISSLCVLVTDWNCSLLAWKGSFSIYCEACLQQQIPSGSVFLGISLFAFLKKKKKDLYCGIFYIFYHSVISSTQFSFKNKSTKLCNHNHKTILEHFHHSSKISYVLITLLVRFICVTHTTAVCPLPTLNIIPLQRNTTLCPSIQQSVDT